MFTNHAHRIVARMAFSFVAALALGAAGCAAEVADAAPPAPQEEVGKSQQELLGCSCHWDEGNCDGRGAVMCCCWWSDICSSACN
jgi:hypothetical protein